ncbi:MAG: thioredoxin domain-containing protein, partial [Candidatus Paceibacterota bacterium]
NINMQKGYTMPVVIIIAGILIAGSVIWSVGSDNNPNSNHVRSQSDSEFRMPSESDHLRGDINAEITIIEYSDFNCVFCARLHPTLSRVVEEYDGEVNWAYRHFANYPQGKVAATGSECVARIGGNDIFWEFADKMFDNQKHLGDQFSIETAVSLGIDETEFKTCLDNSEEIEKEIATDRNEAISLGSRGTPYVVVVTPNGNLIPFNGALPYEQVVRVIEQARNN